MKKILFSMLIGLTFLAPNAYATENESTTTSMSENPYDLVNSKGEIIKYSEIQELIEENGPAKLNPKGAPGSGKLSKEIISRDPSKPLINLGTGVIINERPSVTLGGDLISPFGVIGTDGRSVVSDTSKDPYKKITYLEVEFSDSYGGCTGTVIGKDMVLTNAHCVYDVDDNESIIDAVALPALNKNHYSYGAYWLEDYFYPVGYRNNDGAVQYDFAVLKFKPTGNTEIGEAVGYLPTKQVTDLKDTTIKIYGYPYDKVEETGIFNQWGMSGKVFDEDRDIAYYKIDTYHGQSGSAMLNSSNQIVGVHSTGYSDRETEENLYNGGPKMTKPMVDFITWAFWQ